MCISLLKRGKVRTDVLRVKIISISNLEMCYYRVEKVRLDKIR